MVRHKPLGNLLEDSEGPNLFMNASIEFIRLKQRRRIRTLSSVQQSGFVRSETNQNLGEAAPEFQVHDVVEPEFGQTPVEVVPQHRGVGDQSSCCDEGFLKLLPHHLLAAVLAVWILGEQRQMLHQTRKMAPVLISAPGLFQGAWCVTSCQIL